MIGIKNTEMTNEISVQGLTDDHQSKYQAVTGKLFVSSWVQRNIHKNYSQPAEEAKRTVIQMNYTCQ